MSKAIKVDRKMEDSIKLSDKVFQEKLSEAMRKTEKLSFYGYSENKFIKVTINGLEEVVNVETDMRHAWKGTKEDFKKSIDEAVDNALKECEMARESIAQAIFFQVSEELLKDIEKQVIAQEI